MAQFAERIDRDRCLYFNKGTTMRTDHFQRLLAKLSILTPNQLARLHDEASSLIEESRRHQAIEQAKPVAACEHCASCRIVRNGYNRGLQRYLCRECNRTFNVASGTPLSHLKGKQGFLDQAGCMAQSLSVRATARVRGVAVSAAFSWRHCRRLFQQTLYSVPMVILPSCGYTRCSAFLLNRL